jgi:type IV fimbrial biogenesis protein FimT
MSRGFTIIELLIVLTVAGIMAALVAPSLDGTIAVYRRHAALSQFASDLHRARIEAIRTGRSVHLRLDNSGACTRPARGAAADGWTLVRSDGNELHTVASGELGAGVCVQSTGDASILINSRGLLGPFENRTVWASYHGRADTITVSVLGRVLRRY